MAGKGDSRRPCLVSHEEEALRWDLTYGYITRDEFDRKMKSLRREKKQRRKEESK